MARELPFPKPGTRLPRLTARPKGEYVGVWPRTVGAVVWLGRKLGVRAARRFHEEYYTVWGSTIWHPVGRYPSAGLWLHEGIHAWVGRKLGYLGRKGRRNQEAQSYAAEVVAGYRTIEQAAVELADPIYATALELEEARRLILVMALRWREHGWTRDTLRELGRSAREEIREVDPILEWSEGDDA